MSRIRFRLVAFAGGLLSMGLFAAPARAGLVGVSFSGGSGTPMTITLPQSVSYTVTTAPLGAAFPPIFVFQGVGNIFPGGNFGTGTLTYSINAGSPLAINSASSGASANAVQPTDLSLYKSAGSAPDLGDVIVLSAGTYTTTTNIAAAAPASGSYQAFAVDSLGRQVGVGTVPEPTSLALLGVGGLALLGRRRAGR